MAKVGRPTDYKSSFNKQVEKLCLLGATDKEIANFFEISERALNVWKKKYPKFMQSIKNGKDTADTNIANSLYNRALGYSHNAVKIIVADKKVQQVPYVEHYPPDTTAAIFWLKNRNKEKWRDQQNIEHSGNVIVEEKQPK